MAKQTGPVTMHVTYRPKKGKEGELEALVKKHWTTLAGLGLVTSQPVQLWKATDKRTAAVSFVEIFQWRDEEASTIAHQTPEVMAIWEPMGPILEELKLDQIETLPAGVAKA